MHVRFSLILLAPSTISPAQAAELARLRELEEKVSKSIQTFHIILKPRGPAATAWLVNTNTVTFDDLAEEITQIYRPVSKTDLFTFETNGSRVTAPITDGNLRVLFQTLAARNERTVTIDVKSELKIFSEFKMEEVCKLYGLLYDSRNPLSQFPAFQCTADHVDDNLVCYVMEELNSRTRLTPVVMAPAAHQSVYVYCILHAIGRSSNFDFMVLAERFVEGSKAKGNVDYSIVSRGGLILGVIEVMRQGDIQGIAQNAMQIRSALEYNRKRNPAHVRCFGIATDANFWYFLEYFPDQTPRVSGRYQVMFQGKFVVGAVRKVMGIISWLLKAEPVMSEPQRKRMRLGGVS